MHPGMSLIAGISLCSLALAPLAATAQNHNYAPIRQLPLPQAIAFPEGVAASSVTGDIYTNATVTGMIARVSLESGTVNLLPSPFEGNPPANTSVNALGLKLDQQNRLWIAGGASGTAHVVDGQTGTVLAKFTTPSGNALLNDVILAGDSAYFTDTRRPTIWRAKTDALASGPLEAWLDLSNSPITYGDGANLNGITASADGRYLVVVHMQRGELYRIDTTNRDVRRIQVNSGALNGGDGLLLVGQRLFLVRQPAQEIVALNMSADLLQANEQKRIRSPNMQWPATAALHGEHLIIGNSQLNKRASNTPDLPFNLAVAPLALFDAD